MPGVLPRRPGRRDAAQERERGLGAQPLGVVTGHGQHRGCGIGADPGRPPAARRRGPPGTISPTPKTVFKASPQPPSGRWPARRARRAAGGALQPPAHAAQQLPGVAGMVAVTGPPLDHGGDAGKGPVVGVEPMRAGALAQRLVQVVELLVVKARVGPGGAAACQRLQPALSPAACQQLTFWRATPSWRATLAWERPAANSWPAWMRTCSNAWRSRRPRALRR
jgi:hypothetical protein